jgi:hypothetical protein
MLTTEMVSVVKSFSEKILQENPFTQSAAKGEITDWQFRVYLTNLKWIFKNNTAYLKIAKKRALELGLNKLGDFFESKFAEEVGHEQWAEDDLKLCKSTSSLTVAHLTTVPDTENIILPATHKLIQYLDEIIAIDPTLFLSYMFFTEYFTVLAGPRFLKNLEEKCGIPISSVSAVSKHIQADQTHTAEDLEVINVMVTDANQSELMMKALHGSIQTINAFLAECAGSLHEK